MSELIPTTSMPLSTESVPGIEDLLEAFLSNKSPRTLKAYQQDLEAFRRFLGLPSTETALHMLMSGGAGNANLIVLRFRNWMTEQELAPATTNRRLAALRSAIKLANTLGMVSWQLGVENIKSQAYRDTRGPGTKGVAAILAAAANQRDSLKAARDVAVVRLLHDVALRRGEVVELDLEHIDLEQSTISILGKGRTEREIISIPPATKETLRNWIDARGDHSGALFVNLHHDPSIRGSRLSGRSIHRLIKRLGQKAGIKARPHGLRHTAITSAIRRAKEADLDLTHVKHFSRHASISTVLIYDDRERDVQGTLSSLVSATLSDD